MNLVLDNIRLQFGTQQFHYDVALHKPITGVFGLSGAGKTTLFNCIAGIEKPASGKIVFNSSLLYDGTRRTNVPSYKRNMGVVFQNHCLFPHLTVKNNLLFGLKKKARNNHAGLFNDLVDLLHIRHILEQRPANISGGESQRVAIGRALLSQPRLLLLDEPFSNVDSERKNEIISYLLQINARYDIPMIVISHDLGDILKLTNELLIVEDGRVTAQGRYFDIFQSGQKKNLRTNPHKPNVFNLYCTGKDPENELHTFRPEKPVSQFNLKTCLNRYEGETLEHKKVRFLINSDDIGLTDSFLEKTSIQNQLPGRVKKIDCSRNTCYVTIDVGIDLIAEITNASAQTMDLRHGSLVICLIKSKAVNLVHVYD